MTKRDFFRLVIKLIAFNAVITSILVLPTQFFNLQFGFDDIIQIVGITLLGIVIMACVVYFTIKHTDRLINFFMLDKGYDTEKIEVNSISSQQIIKLLIIFIAGTLIVDNLAYVFVELINSFKFKAYGDVLTDGKPEYYWVYVKLVNIILGVVLLVNSNKIAQFLDRK